MRETLRTRLVGADGETRRSASRDERVEHIGMPMCHMKALLNTRVGRTGRGPKVVCAECGNGGGVVCGHTQRLGERISIGRRHGVIVEGAVHRCRRKAIVASHEDDGGCKRWQRALEQVTASAHEGASAVEEEGDVGTENTGNRNKALIVHGNVRESRVRLERRSRIARATAEPTTCWDMLLDLDDERGTVSDCRRPASLLGCVDGAKDEVITRVEAVDVACQQHMRSRLRLQRLRSNTRLDMNAHDIVQIELLEDGAQRMVAIDWRIGYRETQIDFGASLKHQRL